MSYVNNVATPVTSDVASPVASDVASPVASDEATLDIPYVVCYYKA